LFIFAAQLSGASDDTLVMEGIPEIPAALKNELRLYAGIRGATMNSWHPARREMLISTRFGNTPQLHWVKFPGGARKQMTFSEEPIGGGSFSPGSGDSILFSQDTGGQEFHQYYRLNLSDLTQTLITDGKSRNTGARWSRSGKWLAYTSTRRNGKDNDIYVIDPSDPKTNRILIEVSGGGWGVADWSYDDQRLIVSEYISANESYLYLADAQSGKRELITPKDQPEKILYGGGRFSKDGRSIFVTTDKGGEFHRLARVDLETKEHTFLTSHISWDIVDTELSPDGSKLAFISNEDGVGVLHLMDAQSGKEISAPKLPAGLPFNLEWHANSRDLAFNLSWARASSDVYSADVSTGVVERWTESEAAGLNTDVFALPEPLKIKSFDGLQISSTIYRPDPKKFPGRRPALISIHGGPESQSRPGFQGRYNYLLSEMGIALIYPNVRGSTGYGKTFVTLDNGFKREDSVKDIGALLDWIKTDAALDAERVCVSGGSYGGYMSLACMVHYNERLRCGIDVVGISNFISFLKNTQDYRRDLRRAEYGDERDPAMNEHLGKISPLNHVSKITKPLFVVQGKNDPRVPLSEAEQMVKAIRGNGGAVWYMMAKDEGHGFSKKKNTDAQFQATVLFLREYLLK